MTEFHIRRENQPIVPEPQPQYRADSIRINDPEVEVIAEAPSESDIYVLYGARLDDVEKLMRERNVSAVPVVGFIEELGWFGPTIIGICHANAGLSAVISRDTRPKNICVQSVMTRPTSSVDAQYAGVLTHYRKYHA